MRKIKIIYWIFTFVFAALTVLFAIISRQDERASIILSGVALITSSVAIGLSDQKKNHFKGKVKVWSVLLDSRVADKISMYRVSMQILNESSEPVYDIVYRLRLPSGISGRINNKNSAAREYIHGKSRIIVDDSYGFLTTVGEDGFIPFDFKMQLGKWLEGYVYITVSGSNITPVTFKIDHKQKDKIIKATKDEPFEAIRISR